MGQSINLSVFQGGESDWSKRSASRFPKVILAALSIAARTFLPPSGDTP
jgi:hypothetical protein